MSDIGVREAARILGVHENTVRNWVALGRLPFTRTPGARWLRFNREAVETIAEGTAPGLDFSDTDIAYSAGYRAGRRDALADLRRALREAK